MNFLEISNLEVLPMVDSQFVVPSRVTFNQNGVKRTWDYIKAHDAVAILLFNTTKQAFILVKQFRPALYMAINERVNSENISVLEKKEKELKISVPFEKGVSYELCAGIVDKNCTLVEIAQAEILEETGYQVSIDKIKPLFEYNAVGFSGNLTTVFFAEVTDEMIVNEGGGNKHDGEFIELFYLPIKDAKEFIYNNDYPKTSSVAAAIGWYFLNNS
uniref:Uridine diphosphate glucose pyrophosphatase NUDT14 n=1 Tax=Hydra vulgaris TaxID=6087 RepID=T2MH66_HYDVU